MNSPTGFTVRPYRTHRLDEYCNRYSKDNTHVELDPNVAAALKAQGFTWTFSPRSIYRVDKLYEALYKYDPINMPSLLPKSKVDKGIALARTCFSKPKDREVLQPLDLCLDTVMHITSNPEASAGLTAWGCTKQHAMLRGLERGKQILRAEKIPEPCLAFARTQFGDKTRLVWGYPYAMTILEGLVARPLIDVFKHSRRTPMAFGMSTHTLGSRLRVAARNNSYAYSLDVSSYDASISATLIYQAFDILKTWYNLSQVVPGTCVTVAELFDVVINYFVHTPIVMPDHKLYLGKKHGVPSGSYFTQLIDSIVNVMLAGSISAEFHLKADKDYLFVLGDDMLMWADRKYDLNLISHYVFSTFGIRLNADKSHIYAWDEPVHYLGRIWDKGIPNQDLDEIIARMVYPERRRKYSDDPKVREREVNLLFAAMAATYKDANHILKKVLGTKNTRIAPTADDVKVFGHGHHQLDPNHLSGLSRYNLIYNNDSTGLYRWPTQLVRMWID